MDLATLIDCSYVEYLSPILSSRVLLIGVTNRNRKWQEKKALASPHCCHTFSVCLSVCLSVYLSVCTFIYLSLTVFQCYICYWISDSFGHCCRFTAS